VAFCHFVWSFFVVFVCWVFCVWCLFSLVGYLWILGFDFLFIMFLLFGVCFSFGFGV